MTSPRLEAAAASTRTEAQVRREYRAAEIQRLRHSVEHSSTGLEGRLREAVLFLLGEVKS